MAKTVLFKFKNQCHWLTHPHGNDDEIYIAAVATSFRKSGDKLEKKAHAGVLTVVSTIDDDGAPPETPQPFAYKPQFVGGGDIYRIALEPDVERVMLTIAMYEYDDGKSWDFLREGVTEKKILGHVGNTTPKFDWQEIGKAAVGLDWQRVLLEAFDGVKDWFVAMLKGGSDDKFRGIHRYDLDVASGTPNVKWFQFLEKGDFDSRPGEYMLKVTASLK